MASMDARSPCRVSLDRQSGHEACFLCPEASSTSSRKNFIAASIALRSSCANKQASQRSHGQWQSGQRICWQARQRTVLRCADSFSCWTRSSTSGTSQPRRVACCSRVAYLAHTRTQTQPQAPSAPNNSHDNGGASSHPSDRRRRAWDASAAFARVVAPWIRRWACNRCQ